MRNHFGRSTTAAMCLLALYFAVSIPVALTQSLFLHRWLVWNVFLAMLSPVLAWAFMHCGKRGLRAALAALWCLFFPNAPYLVTDLIHIARLSFGAQAGRLALYPWLTLMQVGAAVFLATTIGLWSLGVMHDAARGRFGSLAGWAAVGLLCLLGGYGVYLGRFVRLNSWDVLRPIHLLQSVLRHMDGDAMRFSAAFGAYILFTYCVYRVYGALKTDIEF